MSNIPNTTTAALSAYQSGIILAQANLGFIADNVTDNTPMLIKLGQTITTGLSSAPARRVLFEDGNYFFDNSNVALWPALGLNGQLLISNFSGHLEFHPGAQFILKDESRGGITLDGGGTGHCIIDGLTIGHQYYIGFVNITGTSLAWVSGTKFNPNWLTGQIIRLSATTSVRVASVASSILLTLTTAPGNASGVAYESQCSVRTMGYAMFGLQNFVRVSMPSYHAKNSPINGAAVQNCTRVDLGDILCEETCADGFHINQCFDVRSKSATFKYTGDDCLSLVNYSTVQANGQWAFTVDLPNNRILVTGGNPVPNRYLIYVAPGGGGTLPVSIPQGLYYVINVDATGFQITPGNYGKYGRPIAITDAGSGSMLFASAIPSTVNLKGARAILGKITANCCFGAAAPSIGYESVNVGDIVYDCGLFPGIRIGEDPQVFSPGAEDIHVRTATLKRMGRFAQEIPWFMQGLYENIFWAPFYGMGLNITGDQNYHPIPFYSRMTIDDLTVYDSVGPGIYDDNRNNGNRKLTIGSCNLDMIGGIENDTTFSGICNVAADGKTVTWVSGNKFTSIGPACSITVNGTIAAIIGKINSSTVLTLVNSAGGALSGVTYSVAATGWSGITVQSAEVHLDRFVLNRCSSIGVSCFNVGLLTGSSWVIKDACLITDNRAVLFYQCNLIEVDGITIFDSAGKCALIADTQCGAGSIKNIVYFGAGIFSISNLSGGMKYHYENLGGGETYQTNSGAQVRALGNAGNIGLLQIDTASAGAGVSVTGAGTAITWLNGQLFDASYVGRSAAVNGLPYVIFSFADNKHLTLQTAAPLNASVSFYVLAESRLDFVKQGAPAWRWTAGEDGNLRLLDIAAGPFEAIKVGQYPNYPSGLAEVSIRGGLALLGGEPVLSVQNTGWAQVARLGEIYAGNSYEMAMNTQTLSSTTCNLDDTSAGGIVLRLINGSMSIWTAAAGANPRTLTKIADFNGSGGMRTVDGGLGGSYPSQDAALFALVSAFTGVIPTSKGGTGTNFATLAAMVDYVIANCDTTHNSALNTRINNLETRMSTAETGKADHGGALTGTANLTTGAVTGTVT